MTATTVHSTASSEAAQVVRSTSVPTHQDKEIVVMDLVIEQLMSCANMICQVTATRCKIVQEEAQGVDHLNNCMRELKWKDVPEAQKHKVSYWVQEDNWISDGEGHMYNDPHAVKHYRDETANGVDISLAESYNKRQQVTRSLFQEEMGAAQQLLQVGDARVQGDINNGSANIQILNKVLMMLKQLTNTVVLRYDIEK